jgi:predicted porin
MFGGVCKAGWATILAGSVLLGGGLSAQAADLGGDCCADLEERIAELEATTARKGNRKVSLTVYGKVNQAIQWWDDGQETNIYNFTNDTSRTRFGLKGKAKITGDWYAGYRIEIGLRAPDQGDLSAASARGDGQEFDLRHSYWTLGNKQYGDINVGQTSMAHDGIQQFTTARTSHFANQDIFDANDDFDIVGLGTVEWSTLAYVFEPGEGSRGNVIRYDSPKYSGFQFRAHYGEDDIWGVALRYSETIGNFKVKGGIGYGEMTEADEECTEDGASAVKSHCTEYGGSLSIMHEPSGLFATGAYGIREDDQKGDLFGDDEVSHWMVQGGIEQQWIPLGDTTIFGGYQEHEAGAIGVHDGKDITDSKIEMFEVGLNQHISAAAMDLYLHYKHYDADVAVSNVSIDTEAWQTVIGGAHIKF